MKLGIGRSSPHPGYAPMRKGRTETERPQRNSIRDAQVLLYAFTRSSVAGFLYALSVELV